MRILTRWLPRAVALAAVAAAGGPPPASANIAVTQVSHDVFANNTSQHQTEVEPDTFSHHGTTVSTFQVGRFFNGGASDIGVARNAGAGWSDTFLPGLTFSAGPFGDPAAPTSASVTRASRSTQTQHTERTGSG